MRDGIPLYHSSQCLPYRLLAEESAILPNAVLSDFLARAYGVWTTRQPTSTCTPGISAIELPPSTETTIVGYRPGERGNNIVGVAPKWTHSGLETLGLSTLTFNPSTGEIYDVDLELNGQVAWSTTGDAEIDPSAYDLWTVLTHEAGHALGFSHSTDPVPSGDGGTVLPAMAPNYEPGGTTGRALTKDDTDAVCAVYPSRNQRLTASGLVAANPCLLAPATPGGSACPEDPELTNGCALAAPSSLAPRGASAVAIVGVAIGLGTLARRRRRATGT